MVFNCIKCDNHFSIRVGRDVESQCIKCGGFILESIKFIELSSVVISEEIKAPKKFEWKKFIPTVHATVNKGDFPSIKILIPYYHGGPRIHNAIKTWIQPETIFVLTDEGCVPPGFGICSQIFTPKNSKSEKIGDKTKPFLIDMLSRMLSLFPDEDYYGYFNSDVILPSGVPIRSLLPEKGRHIAFHHRIDVTGDLGDHNTKLDKKQQVFCGKDGFIATKEVIRDIIANVGDLVLGGANWDDGLAIWCMRRYGVEKVDLRHGEISHFFHEQAWDYDDPDSTFNQRELERLGLNLTVRQSVNWYNAYSPDSEEKQLARQNPIGIIQPGRIGDILIVLPIAKWYYDQGHKIVWPVCSEVFPLFNYINYVEPIDIGPGFGSSYQKSIQELKSRGVLTVIDLGIGFGKDESGWKSSGMSFDEWKYHEAKVPFEKRFDLVIQRDIQKERSLQNSLNLPSSYTLTHSLGSKGSVDFGIKDSIEIQPTSGYTIFDWIGVIEKAEEIFCVDSCIAHLVNQLGLLEGTRVFKPLSNYYGVPLNMAIPKINWEGETPPLSKRIKSTGTKSSGALLVSLPGVGMGKWPLYPLGLGYLSSSLKRDRDVHSIHFQMTEQVDSLLPEILTNLKPGVVGFSCNTFNRGNVRKYIQMVKSISPKSKIVVGGVHATYLPKQIIEDYGADFVVMGEGENTLRTLCSAIENRSDFGDIRGISYLDEGNVRINPSVISETDLDNFPIPDYGYANNLFRDSKMGAIITSRGCPAKCKYCSTSSYWGQKVRVHSVDRVLDEIELLVDRYGIEKLLFHDDTFNISETRVKAICKGILDRGLKITWGCQGRVSPVSKEMLDAMIESGCRHICWGVESGSKELLQSMNKKINFDQVRKAFDICSNYKGILSTSAFTMIGYPGENESTIKETSDFMNTIPLTDPLSTSILYVLPGTEVYEEFKTKNQINDEYWRDTEEVFYNTTEHNFRQLQEWAYKINSCGSKIPFDFSKHFWDKILFGHLPVVKNPEVYTQRKSGTPLHFFTIVLNGMPFIKYHIKLFQSLPFDWHWHIIEGVGDLKYDTSWSVGHGGVITESIHNKGLSIDGTSEYIDELKRLFPRQISIYRKESGKFWDGKVEMVNAPIPNLPDNCLLWQVDVDEFWSLDCVSRMVNLFEKKKDKMAAYVYCYYFVGPNKYISSFNTWATLPDDWFRIFRFQNGFRWSKHEPPTLVDRFGADPGRKNPFHRSETMSNGIYFQHFAYVDTKQVLFKETYYGYKNALRFWNRLQEVNGEEVEVHKYLPWAKRGAMAETWDSERNGKLLFTKEL